MFEENRLLQRRNLLSLLVRITFYYLLISLLTLFTLWLKPGFVDNLPVGGIGQFIDQNDIHLETLKNHLLGSSSPDRVVADKTGNLAWLNSALSLLFAMFATFILMLPVAWVYKAIHRGSDHDHSIDETSLVLPAVVAGIVTVVQHSLALAFSLAGIVAGVHFRRSLTDTFDI